MAAFPAPDFLASLTDAERHALRSYRTAARDVLELFAPDRDRAFVIEFPPAPGPITADLVPLDTFRSLALALRLVYMPREEAHFCRVLAIVRRSGVQELNKLCDLLEADWRRASSGPGQLLVDGVTYTPGQILDIWLYARAFHQDARKQADADRMRSAEPFSTHLMQLAVHDLCFSVRNLDIAVAYLLGEAPPPAIHDAPPRSPAFF